jgi:hypothetical protein
MMSPLRFGALVTLALVGALLASLTGPARPDEIATGSPLPSASASLEPSASPTIDPSPSGAPSETPSPTSSVTPSATLEPTSSPTPAPTKTPKPTATPSGPTLWAMLNAMSNAGLILKNEECTFYPSTNSACTSAYDRDLFRHWVDADRDGCDARREVLIAEALTAPVVGSGCALSGGTWLSLYDGVRATGDGGAFDIDHMVPLKEAWISGAYRWNAARREAFANDLDAPYALIAVSASSNRSKSDRDPASWLPTDIAYRCRYATDWIATKLRWSLTVDFDEYAVLRRFADSCPAVPYSVTLAP